MQPRRFNEFAREERPLDGDKVKIEAILNKEILVTGFKMRDSKYSAKNSKICLTIQFECDGKRQIVFTGSTVLSEQLGRYKEEIPFFATIVKVGEYFTFS